MVLATLGVLASCTGTPMEGQGLGPLNGTATAPATSDAPATEGMGTTGTK
jgi:hypothetical protein